MTRDQVLACAIVAGYFAAAYAAGWAIALLSHTRAWGPIDSLIDTLTGKKQ